MVVSKGYNILKIYEAGKTICIWLWLMETKLLIVKKMKLCKVNT